MAAGGEEDPEEERTGDTDTHNDVFGKERPLGSVEHPDGNHKHDSEIDVAAGEDDSLGQFKVSMHEGSLGAVVGVAEELTIDDKFKDGGNQRIGGKENDAGDQADAEGKK